MSHRSTWPRRQAASWGGDWQFGVDYKGGTPPPHIRAWYRAHTAIGSTKNV